MTSTTPQGPSRVRAPAGVRFTHTDKVLFPEAGYTKADVLSYYRRIAPRLLPHLRDRPATLERLPEGLGGARFWQKDTPRHYPEWIPRIEIPTETGKPVHYAVVNDERALLYLVNQGTITFHTGFSRIADLQRPDFVLFDLDPGEALFSDVVKLALELRPLLEARGAEPSVKTSGKTGLHVTVPWTAPGGFDESRAWARDVAKELVDHCPALATLERSKAGRRGRVYVDVQQNALGLHAAPPWVVRAVPRATVSMPLAWDDVRADLDPGNFTIATVKG